MSKLPGDDKVGAQGPITVNKDVLRKARALNPALAAQGSTTELLSKVKGAQPGGVAGARPGVTTSGPQQDFATGFVGVKDRYKAMRDQIQKQMTELQAQLAQTGPTALNEVVDLVIAIDPNMTSPQTQEILKSEQGFLNEVGFSVRKVIDRKLRKK